MAILILESRLAFIAFFNPYLMINIYEIELNKLFSLT